MKVTVNGEPRELDEATTVVGVVGERTAGIAVAVNDEVIPRSEWATTRIGEGDVIEMLEAHQGG